MTDESKPPLYCPTCDLLISADRVEGGMHTTFTLKGSFIEEVKHPVLARKPRPKGSRKHKVHPHDQG